MSFAELPLSHAMMMAVERLGYHQPTPVQEQAIPLIVKGRDIIAGAQTGTGKTAAFVLPALDKLGHAKGGSGPLMLIITPTRELAMQIGEVCEAVALSTHHRIVTVVGGLSYRPQISRLARGCDILIATPGRLIDLMEQHAVRLGDVELLVLDEADRMLDMGFLPAVKRIVSATPQTRQTLLFSATIDRSVQDVAGRMLRDPARVEISRKGDVAETLDHYIIRVPHLVKPTLLRALLAERSFFRVIVFARTRNRADTAMRRLRRAGYAVEAIHSDRSQNQRKRSLERFAAGEVNIITATDVLARGIDVESVDFVINYDIPDQPEDYIHRIGRTGRAGARGEAITFVTPENDAELCAIEKLLKRSIPELTLESFDMEAAVAESTAQAMRAQANRDPEVRRVKRERGNRAKTATGRSREGRETPSESSTNKRTKASKKSDKKSDKKSSQTIKKRASKLNAKSTGGSSGRKGTAKIKNVAQQTHASRRRGQATHKQDSHKQGIHKQSARKQGGQKKSGHATQADVRPGRARRAEVQRSRRRS